MKRVFIIHGWGGYPEEGWFPWLKKELEERGFNVQVPAMPDPSHPQKDAWLEKLREIIGTSDEETYLVGHSLGGGAIYLYLQSLPADQRIGGVVTVAGVASEASITNRINEVDGAWDVLGPWIKTPHNWQAIKDHADFFTAIFSDTDVWIRTETADLLQEKLHARTMILQNMRHFSGDDGITKLPEALAALL